ncbi:hypothetical protein KQX54_019702 [Cotesia glomerata]|uniref:Uncharacterized protein n=1 Tax=Cotesia glomerata TaxID=32391 RepID=A0AAV7J0V9_COTGL|nr:hypothetical protein KQX54_019702 [Cotesia glomerata]
MLLLLANASSLMGFPGNFGINSQTAQQGIDNGNADPMHREHQTRRLVNTECYLRFRNPRDCLEIYGANREYATIPEKVDGLLGNPERRDAKGVQVIVGNLECLKGWTPPNTSYGNGTKRSGQRDL